MVKSGNSTGSGGSGQVQIFTGTSASTTSTGVLSLFTGDATGGSAASGAVSINTGAVTSGAGASGAISLDVGSSTGTAGAINLGSTNASAINIGKTSGASSVNLQAGTGNLNLQTNSASAKIVIQSLTNSATAFQVQNAAGTGIVLDADTSNGRVGINNAAPAYALDVTGDINSSTQLRVGGTVVCTSAGCTAAGAGTNVSLQATSPGTAQTGNFNITGTGIAGTLQATTVYGNTVDSVTSGTALNIGTTNATTGINLGQNTSIASGKTLTVQGSTLFKPATDTATVFQVQPSGVATPVFDVDTLHARIGINNNAPAYDLDVTGTIRSSTALLIGSTSVCDATGSTGCIAKSGSGYYIHNQIGVQAANLYVQAATTGTVAATFQAFNGGTGDIADFLNGSGTTVASFNSAGSVLLKAANSATAFQVQNSTGAAYLTVDTQNAIIKIGDTISAASIVVGDGTNNATFASTTHELTLNGSAQHTRRITLQPEFAGAVMTAQNGCASCNGSMTSDMDPASGASTLSSAEGYAHSYYAWTTTQGTNQNYDIWVSYTLPSDYAGLKTPSAPFSVWAKTSDTTNGTVTMQVFNATRSTPAYCYGSTTDTPASLTPTTANTWQQTTTGSMASPGCTFSANDRIWIRFRLQAPTSGITRLGELSFDYLSKW
jgi:hypothetical protein